MFSYYELFKKFGFNVKNTNAFIFVILEHYLEKCAILLRKRDETIVEVFLEYREFNPRYLKYLKNPEIDFDRLYLEDQKGFNLRWIKYFPDYEWDFKKICESKNFEIPWLIYFDKYKKQVEWECLFKRLDLSSETLQFEMKKRNIKPYIKEDYSSGSSNSSDTSDDDEQNYSYKQFDKERKIEGSIFTIYVFYNKYSDIIRTKEFPMVESDYYCYSKYNYSKIRWIEEFSFIENIIDTNIIENNLRYFDSSFDLTNEMYIGYENIDEKPIDRKYCIKYTVNDIKKFLEVNLPIKIKTDIIFNLYKIVSHEEFNSYFNTDYILSCSLKIIRYFIINHFLKIKEISIPVFTKLIRNREMFDYFDEHYLTISDDKEKFMIYWNEIIRKKKIDSIEKNITNSFITYKIFLEYEDRIVEMMDTVEDIKEILNKLSRNINLNLKWVIYIRDKYDVKLPINYIDFGIRELDDVSKYIDDYTQDFYKKQIMLNKLIRMYMNSYLFNRDMIELDKSIRNMRKVYEWFYETYFDPQSYIRKKILNRDYDNTIGEQ